MKLDFRLTFRPRRHRFLKTREKQTQVPLCLWLPGTAFCTFLAPRPLNQLACLLLLPAYTYHTCLLQH
jgi:hypothetical protein